MKSRTPLTGRQLNSPSPEALRAAARELRRQGRTILDAQAPAIESGEGCGRMRWDAARGCWVEVGRMTLDLLAVGEQGGDNG